MIPAMTAFVESCVGTIAGSAVAAERRARGRPRARRLLKTLADKRNILVTTHLHPDPDALGSTLATCILLEAKLPHGPKITLSLKGQVGGGINEAFFRMSVSVAERFAPVPWDDAALASYDAIVLLDTQPHFRFSPLPQGVPPTAVIDHHRGRGRTAARRREIKFHDVRTDVGSTSAILFSYFMELEMPIKPDLGATLLYAIESDLAGAAGTPGELDNIALSGLTLVADTRKLYQMRHVDLPQSYYVAYAEALANAVWHENVLMTRLGVVDSLEQPAVMADFLLRFDKAQWALVTAIHDSKLVLSLRTSSPKSSAADVMRKILRQIGEGGGHRTKAGGFVDIAACTPVDLARIRTVLWRRLLRATGAKPGKGQPLVAGDTLARAGGRRGKRRTPNVERPTSNAEVKAV